ncbi:MAG TPA: protein kinase [Thermoanaerobaculia bacterium]|nr:protein kinase [Thermoanaerobaculia bacterium]
MTLAPGTRLGSYEIVAPLGAGGMGEVYRARDARLSREVAIKVLPAAVASDPDRRLRFEQEARSASALNHPNILTIYDVGSADGTVYIAMELIEGRTLRELIAGGEPVPMKRLLEVATQTAEGLAKAHGAGIVHRDLKPENVMVSKDGFVKILDFGLAKLIEPVTQDASVLPTAIAAPTTPGTVMGTAGYMSPEQASGQSVDYRSDQFTLGAILYEMATGKRAFARKTGAETLVAIIREEPEPIAQLAPKSPAPVRWIVDRLLAKDPEERYASTKDLARDLKSVRDHLSETTSSASGALEAAEPARARRRGWMLPAALMLLAGLGAGYLLKTTLGTKTVQPVTFQRLTYQRGRIYSARFAPDGQTIVYSAAWEGGPLQVFSARADSSEYRPLGLSGAAVLSISTSGELAVQLNNHYVLGYQTSGTLARVPLAGGAPREILEDVQDADWSPDGKQLAVCRLVGNRGRLEYPIGKPIVESAGWLSSARFSPDGRLIAFIDHPQFGNNDGFIKIAALDGTIRATGPFARGNVGELAWSPKGDEVWFGGIEALSISGKVRQVWSSPSSSLHDVSRDGKVLFDESVGRRELIGVASPGAAPRNLTALNWAFPTDISQTTGTVLFYEQQIEPSRVYTRKLDGSPPVQIGEGEAYAMSPDGRYALTVKLPERHPITLLPTGPGDAKTVDIGNITCQWARWMPDGGRLVLGANEPGKGPRLWLQDVSGGRPRPITPEGVSMTGTALSPDGRSILARGPDGRQAIYPVEPGEPRPVPGLQADEVAFGWTANGRSIFVTKLSGVPGVVSVLDVATGERRLWKEFLPPDPTGVDQVGPDLITPDEKSYVYSYRRSLGDLYLATGIK